MEKSLVEQIKEQFSEETILGKEWFENPSVYEREIITGVKWQTTRYGHHALDRHSPYKQGQLTCIIGHTNVGKSTFIIYLLSQLLAEKKIIIYSAENRISQIVRWLIAFHWHEHDYAKYFAWLRERVMFIRHAKQFTYKEVLEQASISDDIGFNADALLIDPYNALKMERGRNGHEYHYEAIEDMRIFTAQTKKSIFLNCHTVTESQRTRKDQDGERPAPQMGDVEGGAKFPNKADDVWVVHRNTQHVDEAERFITKLHVEKVRNTEGGGYPTPHNEPISFTFKRDWTGFTTGKAINDVGTPF